MDVRAGKAAVPVAGRLAGLVGATLALLAGNSAMAQTITFNGLDNGTIGVNSEGPAVPYGYGGLDWSNFYVLNAFNYYTSPGQVSGYQNAAQVAGVTDVAFNAYGNGATLSSPSSGGFNLTDAGFGAAWSNGMTVTALGVFTNGAAARETFVVGTGSVVPGAQAAPGSGTGYYDVQFNWSNLSYVSFIPSGGTNAGLNGQGEQFALTFVNASVNPGTGSTDLLSDAGLGAVNWSSGPTWQAASAPQSGDNVFLNNPTGIDQSFTTTVALDTGAALNNLFIDANSPSDAMVTLVQSANALTTNVEVIGTNGPAQHLQTGGSNSVGSLTVSPYGTYSLSGGTLAAGNLQVTRGSLLQSGGSVVVYGTVTNAGTISVSNGNFTATTFVNSVSSGNLAGSLTIGAGGKVTAQNYTQVAGVTVMAGGNLDPATLDFRGGALSGFGVLAGSAINVSGGTAVTASGGTLQFQGAYHQTGGSFTFADAAARAMFDPGQASFAGTSIVFDFATGSSPAVGSAFQVDNWFLSSDGRAFSAASSLAGTFQGDSFEYEVGGGPLYLLGFDPTAGTLTLTGIAAVPEPGPAALMAAGLLLLFARTTASRRGLTAPAARG